MAWKASCVSPRGGSEGGKKFEWANKISPNSFLSIVSMHVVWGLIATSKFILIQLGWGGNYF